MVYKIRFIVFVLLAFGLFSCDPDPFDAETTIGDWTRITDFAGSPRNGSVSFVIDGRAFVGTGFNGSRYLRDFYEFDPNQGQYGTWFRRADLPGPARSRAVAFSANGKGYVGTGFNGLERLSDFWAYDPGTDAWTQIGDLPAQNNLGQTTPSYRFDATAVSMNGKGYVGLGFGNTDSGFIDGGELNDWWEYDPGTNTWAQKASFPFKQISSFAFVLGGKAYVGGGIRKGQYPAGFFEYDPEINGWNRKRDIGNLEDFDYNLQRASPATFVINDRAFITLGSNRGILPDTWEYDIVNDIWIQRTSFEGILRETAVGFALNNKGYVVTGRSGPNTNIARYDETWEFNPDVDFAE